MDKAFNQANKGTPALVAFASHDFRDLSYEVKYLRDMIYKISKNIVKLNSFIWIQSQHLIK